MSVAILPDVFLGATRPSRPGAPGPDRRPKLRMLLSSAGRRVSLLRSFRSSANILGIDLEIFACDMQPEWSSACIESDYAFAAPPATSEMFVETLLAFCERHAIGLLVPTIDTELIPLAQAKERFAAVGTLVAISGVNLVEMARDKLSTARFLAQSGIPAPRTESLETFLSEEDYAWAWPLIAKPRHGSSSQGVHVVNNRAEVEKLKPSEPYVVQQMLQGNEHTVNLFFDEEGGLQCAVPHQRLRIRAGEVEKGFTTRDPSLCELARNLAAVLDRPFGPLCFQTIVDASGQGSVFEINARFGGGYPLTHRAGATFTRWLIEQCLNLPRTMGDRWQSDVVMLRYDDAVFV